MAQNDYSHLNQRITKERFFELRDDPSTHRKEFGKRSGVQKAKKSTPTFSVKFQETIRPIYESMTGNQLIYNQQYEQFYHWLDRPEAIGLVERWEKNMGDYVFLRDCLFTSIALSAHMEEDNRTQTNVGKVFNYAKYKVGQEKHARAVEVLAGRMIKAIEKLPFYREATHIAAVPPRPGKEFDLPSALVAEIARKRKMVDITDNFRYSNQRVPVKTLERNQKWANCEQSGLSFNGQLDQPVILIDDLYQSGVTVNYTAMTLQQAGATSVYGLYAVKSQRDTDNT